MKQPSIASAVLFKSISFPPLCLLITKQVTQIREIHGDREHTDMYKIKEAEREFMGYAFGKSR